MRSNLTFDSVGMRKTRESYVFLEKSVLRVEMGRKHLMLSQAILLQQTKQVNMLKSSFLSASQFKRVIFQRRIIASAPRLETLRKCFYF